ncbi:MAG TPA: NmrA family NAD(P)-binding protein [Candidatus Acidoferrales bacterium]
MYVVTGASGNSGHVVAEKLLKAGKKVRTIGRSAERLEGLVAQGAEPFICDLADRAALAKAFAGAEGVYAMVPPDETAEDYRASQDRVTDALASALSEAKVKHVVSLSSFGADKAKGTGPVVGLHELEGKLNQIPGLNVLHLRAGYFMENTFAQIGIIKAMGVTAGPLRAEIKLPMIATRDIGTSAADRLLRLDFTGQRTAELLGERDITMAEVAGIVGRAIGKPALEYLQLPNDQVHKAMIQMGMSKSIVDLILEMAGAINSGHMGALENRSPANATPTSYETFVSQSFLPRFKGVSAKA